MTLYIIDILRNLSSKTKVTQLSQYKQKHMTQKAELIIYTYELKRGISIKLYLVLYIND